MASKLAPPQTLLSQVLCKDWLFFLYVFSHLFPKADICYFGISPRPLEISGASLADLFALCTINTWELPSITIAWTYKGNGGYNQWMCCSCGTKWKFSQVWPLSLKSPDTWNQKLEILTNRTLKHKISCNYLSCIIYWVPRTPWEESPPFFMILRCK